jgi:hypothetical protein
MTAFHSRACVQNSASAWTLSARRHPTAATDPPCAHCAQSSTSVDESYAASPLCCVHFRAARSAVERASTSRRARITARSTSYDDASFVQPPPHASSSPCMSTRYRRVSSMRKHQNQNVHLCRSSTRALTHRARNVDSRMSARGAL